jgi:hypothetical protein
VARLRKTADFRSTWARFKVLSKGHAVVVLKLPFSYAYL